LWNPPGTGDVFFTLYHNGILQKLIDQGKEYLFLSNIENFGGVVGHSNFKLLNHLESNPEIEFINEVAERHITDHLGGIFVRADDHKIKLLELSQIPQGQLDKFKANKFKYWNTNNIWIRLKSLKKAFDDHKFHLSVLATVKKQDDHQELYQLTMPASTAIENFSHTQAVIVPRMRYREVKTTADLLILQSNLFKMTAEGSYSLNPARPFNTIPVVKLGDHFKTFADFAKRFKGSIPDMIELDHLTVSGDVYFGTNVTLKGNVIIVANHGEVIHIPDNAILENKIVAGTLRILDH
jgi:UTP--glucose-1-phosphate uridylyltransferase